MESDITLYDDEASEEERKARLRRLIIIALVIIAIIALVLTFGWFYRNKKKKEEEKKKKKLRLAEVEASIKILQARKDKIERRERIIKLFVRIGIGILLIILNCIYVKYKIENINFEDVSSKLLNLNAVIITAYSFVAFVTYGSIESFVRRMKEILAGVLRQNHLESLEELELLIKERETLKKEIESLETAVDEITFA